MLIIKYMNKKYTENDYIQECNNKGLEYIGNHKENKKGTMIEFICHKHRNKGIQFKDWSHFRTSKFGCSFCYGRNQTTEEIQRKISNKDVLLISEYKGNEKPIKCRCKKCGNEWSTKPKVLLTNKAGCPKCGRIKSSNSEMKTHKQFMIDMANANPNIDILSEYNGSKKPIKCKCKICGHIWETIPSRLLNRSCGCSMCNVSNGELSLLLTLDELGISYVTQKKIDGCKYKRSLMFDAFDVENNVAFEYNGEQHYDKRDMFKVQHERDKAKYKFCEDNNIPIIIVPYWEFYHMKEFILNEFQKKGLYKDIA